MKRTLINLVLGTGIAVSFAGVAQGADYRMVVDSGNDRVLLFDGFDGTLVNDNFIDIAGSLPDGMVSSTPKHALQVGDEIWITDQLRDRIDRFSLDGSYLSSIGGEVPGGGLDNIRGMGMIDGSVYVANAGSNNDAPGQSLVQINPNTGDIIGNFSVDGSPWTPLAWDGNIAVSFSGGSDSRIELYDFDGDSQGIFHQGQANFIQQINPSSSGGMWAAAFSGLSTRGIYEYDADGNQVNFWNLGAARGVNELGNGMVMWADGAGVDILDPSTGVSTTIFDDGSFQYISTLTLPAPGALGLLALAGVAGGRTRRRSS